MKPLSRKSLRTSRAQSSTKSRLEPVGMPPQINVHPISSRVFRFINGNTTGTTYITRKCLLRLYGLYVNATVAQYSLIQAIRVKRVSMWAMASAAVNTTAMQTFGCEWTDPHGPSIQKTASCTTTIPGHLVTRPPPDSFGGFWSQVTATTLYNEIVFQLNYIPYTTVDLEVELVFSDGTTGNSEFLTATGTGTSDWIGYSALDNATTAGTIGVKTFVPQCDQVLVWAT
jgi:hypothetical protein